MITRAARIMQWFCVIVGTADFGVGVWRAVDARWGWMAFELGLAGFMAFMWRVNGRTIEREQSTRLHEELWR